MLRRKAWLVLVPVAALRFLACVGDEAAVPPSDGDAAVGPGSDSSTGGDGGVPTDGSAPTDGAGDDAADAGPPCGYPGELCCDAPATPCRLGTTCSTGAPKRCMVNEVIVVGDYFAVKAGPQLVYRMVTARWDGSVWEEREKLDTDFRVGGVWASAPGQYRVVLNKSGEGKYYFLEGVNWKDCNGAGTCAGPLGTLKNLYAITNINNNWWLGGIDAFYRCVAPARCALLTTGVTGQTWGQGNFTGPSESDLWYSAQTKAYHYNGTAWTLHDGIKARSIYQVRKDDVWVGDQTFQHWNGTAWGAEQNVDGNPAPFLISSIGGAEPNDLIAVGNNGGVSGSAHWNGTEWKLAAMPGTAVNVANVYAPSKIEAFAGGDDNLVFKWDGATWTQMASPTITIPAGEMNASVSWRAVAGVARPRP